LEVIVEHEGDAGCLGALVMEEKNDAVWGEFGVAFVPEAGIEDVEAGIAEAGDLLGVLRVGWRWLLQVMGAGDDPGGGLGSAAGEADGDGEGGPEEAFEIDMPLVGLVGGGAADVGSPHDPVGGAEDGLNESDEIGVLGDSADGIGEEVGDAFDAAGGGLCEGVGEEGFVGEEGGED
jgi:hypothetical protein